MRLTPLGKLLFVLIGLAILATAIYRFSGPQVGAWVERLRSDPTRPDSSAPPADGGAAAVAAARPDQPAVAIRLRLQGSNTIGRDLAPALAEAFLTAEGGVRARRQKLGEEELRVLADFAGEALPVAIDVRAHGSSTAFSGLARGDADIGMSSRRVRPDERRELAALGDLASPACEHVLALDGVALVVHRANPIDSLSVADLREIFAGSVTDWSRFGGAAGPIRLHARDDKSGTYDTFKNLVLGDRSLSGEATRHEDSRRLVAEVVAHPGAIGFVGLAYAADAKALKVSEGRSLAYRPGRP